jgi:hypothetical protein
MSVCKQSYENYTKQCSEEDRYQAECIAFKIIKLINHVSEDPNRIINKIVDYYAQGGVYSTAINPVIPPFFSNFYGRKNIKEYLLASLTAPGEIDRHIKVRQIYWDCITRTLTIEWTWSALLTKDRPFVFGLTGPTVILPAGATYSQDMLVCYKFDCDFKLVFSRQYYDGEQFVSTFTKDYPPVCKIKCSNRSKSKHNADIIPNIIPPCTSCDREKAMEVLQRLNFAIDLLTTNPVLAVDLYVAEFAPNGVWSTSINPSTYPYNLPLPQANFVGHKQIREFFLAYALNPGEKNQKVVNKSVHWDCISRTLSVQRTWSATLTAPRPFGTTILQPGDPYEQDDFVILRFDCNYKMVYYHEYFDTNQYQTTYPSVISPACSSTCNCVSCNVSIKK